MTNLAENLVRSAATFPDRPARRLGATTLTYAELDDPRKTNPGKILRLTIDKPIGPVS